MNTILLGAGASKSYDDSVTGVKMPIARDFFRTFNSLDISGNPWVLVGHILHYLNVFHNISWMDFIVSYNEDIEIFHSEVEERFKAALCSNSEIFSQNEGTLAYSAYTQLIFLFASVINEIQNGKKSVSHSNLARKLTAADCIITFNWDTLMDRALYETSMWNIESGYFVKPALIYRNGWKQTDQNIVNNAPVLLKLHGSTNWLTSIPLPDKGKMKPLQETPPSEFYVYVSTSTPYSTYQGRYMEGYSDFSYGYYPPNLPLRGISLPEEHLAVAVSFFPKDMPKGTASSEGLTSMPLIIPPVKKKNYDYFGSLFSSLWEKAKDTLERTDRIIVIGYSFPVTDTQTDFLFTNAFLRRKAMPDVIIVDPYPDRIAERFVWKYGIKKRV